MIRAHHAVQVTCRSYVSVEDFVFCRGYTKEEDYYKVESNKL